MVYLFLINEELNIFSIYTYNKLKKMIFFGNFFAYVYSLHRSYGQVLIFWAIISSPSFLELQDKIEKDNNLEKKESNRKVSQNSNSEDSPIYNDNIISDIIRNSSSHPNLSRKMYFMIISNLYNSMIKWLRYIQKNSSQKVILKNAIFLYQITIFMCSFFNIRNNIINYIFLEKSGPIEHFEIKI